MTVDDEIPTLQSNEKYSTIIKNTLRGGISYQKGLHMEKNATITIKKNLNVTDLAGEKVMVDFETGKYFMIKGVGNDIWDMLQEETTPAKIIENLLKEYDVTPQECEKSVMEFLAKLEELAFLG